MIDQLDIDQILSDISNLEAGVQNLYNATVHKLDTEIDEIISEIQNLYELVDNLEAGK